jgi:hypothetical protein
MRLVRHEHICDFLQSHLPTCTSKRHTQGSDAGGGRILR